MLYPFDIAITEVIFMTAKRDGYISWDEYFMGVSLLAAKRSKDPSTQVGACIIDDQNRILSTGYNGFPQGCSDDEFPWTREGELNAILNARAKNLAGSKLYVSLFPCHECAKAIIQSGVREIIYLSDKYNGTPSDLASKRMLNSAGVKLTKLKPTKAQLVLNFEEFN